MKSNLGETAEKMNRMMGFGPVLLNASQVVGPAAANRSRAGAHGATFSTKTALSR